MSSIGTLYTFAEHGRGHPIRAAAAYAGLSLDLPASLDLKSPEFLEKFPLGKIPALETKDGFRLFETIAILRYVAALAPNSHLLPSDVKESALLDQWLSVTYSECGEALSVVMRFLYGYLTPYNKPIHMSMIERQNRALRVINQHLASRTYLVTERITVADIALASILHRAVQLTLDAPTRAELPHLIRHYETVVNHPKMKDVFGPIKYADKIAQYVPPAKKEEKKEKEAAPKAEKPKAEKPKKKAAEEEEEEEDDLVPKEEVKKNPLDSLPKSTFNLEDWKRAYSNKDTRGPGGALEWFYENFDKEGFSVWRVDFKYNNELTQTFMSSNQIGGFFNRLEASRKYLFGSVGVLGATNDSIITGALVARGQDVVPVVEVAPDFESYAYTRLDLGKEEDRAFFEGALAWDLEVEGKKWVDGKNFK